MKGVYGAKYFTVEALKEIDVKLQKLYYKALETMCKANKFFSGEHNLIKIAKGQGQVTLLQYQGLHQQPHPYLEKSYTVNLNTKEVNVREYENNQMILHRLEEMLSEDNPRIEKLKTITELEEERGMYENKKKIGRKNYWNELCKEKGMPLSINREMQEVGPQESKAHNTARSRKNLSVPVRWGLKENIIQNEIIDWGCGKGSDSYLLKEKGYSVYSYDPYYSKIDLDKIDYAKVDTILLNYVLNVVQNPLQRFQILQEIKDKVKTGTKLLVAVRGHKSILRNAKKSEWEKVSDGFITGSNTFQKGYSKDEFKTLLSEIGEVTKTKKISGGHTAVVKL